MADILISKKEKVGGGGTIVYFYCFNHFTALQFYLHLGKDCAKCGWNSPKIFFPNKMKKYT